jgi:hypothetical protein
LEEDAHRVCDDLFLGVWEIANALDFLALLDSVYEHLGQIAGGQWAAEQCVICVQHHHVHLAVQNLELAEDVDDGHRRVPPRQCGVVRHFELIRYIGIEHAEACPHDVLVGQVVVFVAVKRCLDHFHGDLGNARPTRKNRHRTGIGWDGESRAFQKKVCGGVHREAQPTVDVALGARKLRERLHDVFLEGANICEIRTRLQ